MEYFESVSYNALRKLKDGNYLSVHEITTNMLQNRDEQR